VRVAEEVTVGGLELPEPRLWDAGFVVVVERPGLVVDAEGVQQDRYEVVRTAVPE
jgi:hypothetical protein